MINMTLSQQLRAQAEELEKLAASLKAAAKGLDAIGGGNGRDNKVDLPAVSDNQDGVFTFQTTVPTAAPPDSLSGLDLIASILQEAHQPVNIQYIVSKLEERGRALGHNTVQSYLSRDKRFANVARGRWTLAEFLTSTERKEAS
jgi:hypothetical protein